MKKILSLLLLASVFTACNNKTEEKAVLPDSLKSESPLMDAVNTADSANKIINAPNDSGNIKADTVIKK